MHETYGGTGILARSEPPDPASHPVRRARRGKGFVAALVAGAVVLLCANGAVAYFGYRISLDEKAGGIERVR
jgi:type VI protein secretion system component VasF